MSTLRHIIFRLSSLFLHFHMPLAAALSPALIIFFTEHITTKVFTFFEYHVSFQYFAYCIFTAALHWILFLHATISAFINGYATYTGAWLVIICYHATIWLYIFTFISCRYHYFLSSFHMMPLLSFSSRHFIISFSIITSLPFFTILFHYHTILIFAYFSVIFHAILCAISSHHFIIYHFISYYAHISSFSFNMISLFTPFYHAFIH